MKKSTKKALVSGVAVAAALGAAGAYLFGTKSGKKLQKNLKSTATGIYKQLLPELKKLKHVTKADYEKLVGRAVTKYAEVRKLSAPERAVLMRQAKGAWSMVKKRLK